MTCWGTGTPLREFLHVDDLGEACVFALERWDPDAAATISWDSSKPDGTPKKQLDVSRLAGLAGGRASLWPRA